MKFELGKPKIHIESLGDTWDVSWADDDLLYLQSDDTTGFDGQPIRNMSFHILEGNAPENLKGHTFNTMDEYGRMGGEGADGCLSSIHSRALNVDGVLYDFVVLHKTNKLQVSETSSLVMSTDKGRTWCCSTQETFDKPMTLGPRFGSPYFIAYGKGGKWGHPDTDKYVYAVGNDGSWKKDYTAILGRVLKTKIGQLNAADWQFLTAQDGLNDEHWSSDIMQAKPLPADDCMWKFNGSTCVDGALYAFVSRHSKDLSLPSNVVLPRTHKIQTAKNSSLIVSTDKGCTWRRSAQENYHKPMFPGLRFGSPYFIKYGKDGKADVHNADKYIYAVSNDGSWDNGDDMILGRVLRSKIGKLEAADWQFFTGQDGMSDANWISDYNQAKPILVDPGKCSMTGVQYIEPLKRYVMIQWYFTKSAHNTCAYSAWNFYQSPTPWGPWESFGSQTFDAPEGFCSPTIVSKFISKDGLNLTLFTNGDWRTNCNVGTDCVYRLVVMPCTLKL